MPVTVRDHCTWYTPVLANLHRKHLTSSFLRLRQPRQRKNLRRSVLYCMYVASLLHNNGVRMMTSK